MTVIWRLVYLGTRPLFGAGGGLWKSCASEKFPVPSQRTLPTALLGLAVKRQPCNAPTATLEDAARLDPLVPVSRKPPAALPP